MEFRLLCATVLRNFISTLNMFIHTDVKCTLNIYTDTDVKCTLNMYTDTDVKSSLF